MATSESRWTVSVATGPAFDVDVVLIVCCCCLFVFICFSYKDLRKYSHCINSKVKLTSEYRDRCIKPFSLDNEYVHEKALKEKPMFGKFHRDSCCVINRWYRCIMGMINHECGPVASDAFPYMLYYSLSDLICSRDSYDPEDPKKCPMNEIAAPADFQNGVPRGLQSNSFYSHFFSQSCPNVGYGIDNMVR